MVQREYSHSRNLGIGLKAKTIISAVAISMLPVLTVGSATYYFGRQAMHDQGVQARRVGIIPVSETVLVQQKQLLLRLLTGTGAIALLAGGLAAIWANRNLEKANADADATPSQDQHALRSKQTQLLTEAISYIRTSVTEKDICKAIVEGARQAIAADRVLIYCLDEYLTGKVIAESVDLNWPRALGKIIDDPSFSVGYMEQYQDGQIHVIDNVDEAQLDEGYLERLATYAVQADLVAPLMSQEKLIGLLIAHQCSSPRVWQQSDINLFAQIATQAGFALDNAKLLTDYSQLRRQFYNARFASQAECNGIGTQLFANVTSRIRESLNEEVVLLNTTEEVRSALHADRVVVYQFNADGSGTISAESVSPNWPNSVGYNIDKACMPEELRTDYLAGRVVSIPNVLDAAFHAEHAELLDYFQVKANLTAPIITNGKLFGLLIAHECNRPREWHQSEIDFFTQIAKQVGFALEQASMMTRVDTEGMQAKLFASILHHIRESLNEEQVLFNTVEEVRKAIRVDRVVIYSFDEHWDGTILAEAVVPGFPKSLGAKLNDSCFKGMDFEEGYFERDYVEHYRNGRIRSINNIYKAGLSDCHIEMLEQFAIKANIMAPIIKDGQLFGLLIVHQCSRPRTWQQTEIDFLGQLATQVGFALDHARLLERVDTMASEMRLFSEITRHIRASLNEEDILFKTAEESRTALRADRVVIYVFDEHWDGTILAEAVVPGCPKSLGAKLNDSCFKGVDFEGEYCERDYVEQYRNGRIRAINNIYKAGLSDCHVEMLAQFAIKANIMAPIIKDEQLFGLLIVHQCSRPRTWQQSEIDFLGQLASQVGFALDHARALKRVEQVTQTVESSSSAYSPV